MTSTGNIDFTFDNSFAREMVDFYAPWDAASVPAPAVMLLNLDLGRELGIELAEMTDDDAAALFSGNRAPEGATTLAQAYAGHQFGGFSPQLGDGRALLLGEVIDTHGQRRDIQLKGSGRTPFSRGGDGKAPLGPVLREYLIGEAMHALGVPTTRALAAVTTGETVYRETGLPGAILTRVAASHIRVGTFQFFAVRRDTEKIRQLADYVIARHYPAARETDNPYLSLLDAVCDAQARLVAQWMHLGFIHGVMNTDNMTISGETIDYGPCAFMERYAPATVFSSIDEQGRYAYANQPVVAQWNLARLAETLIGIVDDDAEAATTKLTESIVRFPEIYQKHWLAGMRAKLGLTTVRDGDLELLNALFEAMDGQGVDYTKAMRGLSSMVRGGDGAAVRNLFNDPLDFDAWVERWLDRGGVEDADSDVRAANMDRTNPIYIPRNHIVEAALTSAVDRDDLAPFHTLLEVLADPFTRRDGLEAYEEPAPETAALYQTFCGT